MGTKNNSRTLFLARSCSVLALGFAVMSSSSAFAQSTSDPETQANPEKRVRDEVVVTAQHREQTLLEVPQSISVIAGDKLELLDATSFEDFAALVPGLNITQASPGETRLILRGINTGSPASTVAVYVDDVPFGASGGLSNAGILAGDFDTFDVERVEVLRGPQGTLYGANSLGGVIKYITAKPNTEVEQFRAQVGGESTEDGGVGYSGNVLANIPLSENFAFRASGFYRQSVGYIDSVGLGSEDVNESNSFGGRASLLFVPNDDLSVRLSAVLQTLDTDSPSTFTIDPVSFDPVDPVTGAPTDERKTYERFPAFNETKYNVYSGTVNYNLDFAELTSITSYATQRVDDQSDVSTNALRPTAGAVYGNGMPNSIGIAYQNNIDVEKFTQEVRLASVGENRLNWQIGAYYTDQNTVLDQEFLPFDLDTKGFIDPAGTFGPLVFDKFITAQIFADYEEIAGFANATYDLTDRLDVTVGGRYSHNSQSNDQGIIQLGGGSLISGESSENVFTWSVSPRFEINDNTSIFARVAKGYRPGGPNSIPVGAPADFPSEYDSDTLISYEAGLRAETPNQMFSFDAAIYYLDWKDIQITAAVNTPVGPVGVNSNGEKAESYGAEASVTARPLEGLTLVGNVAYNKAKLLDDTVPSSGGVNLTGGLAGDRLPYSPELTANISADYDWSLSNSTDAFIGGSLRYISDQVAGFDSGYRATFGERLELDSYAVGDLRAGVILDRVTISAFVKNVTDEYGLVTASYGTAPFNVPAAIGGNGIPLATATSIRPRTFGASVGVTY